MKRMCLKFQQTTLRKRIVRKKKSKKIKIVKVCFFFKIFNFFIKKCFLINFNQNFNFLVFFEKVSSERNFNKPKSDQIYREKKILNISEKNKNNYQNFIEDMTRNSLITSKDTSPFSIPSHPNYEASEEKRNKPSYLKQNKKNSQNKLENEDSKPKENMEIFNFDDKNSKPSESLINVIHQISKENIKSIEPDSQLAPFTFKEVHQPKMLIQTPKGLFRNATPFIISSARLPETQKILNSFRNDPNFDVNNLEIKNSAASNKGVSPTCLICFDKPPDAVFMECGHGGAVNFHFFSIYLFVLYFFYLIFPLFFSFVFFHFLLIFHRIYLFYLFFIKGVCYDCSLELWKSTGECYLCRNVEFF